MNRASHLMLCSVLLLATPALADMGKTAEPLIARGGSKAESHINTGIEHYGMGRWDVAKNHSVEAEKADPQSKKAHTRLGLVLNKSGDHAGARGHFNRALGLGKNNVDIQSSEILKKHVKM
jgi:Tfp pilus assembly protein PilF